MIVKLNLSLIKISGKKEFEVSFKGSRSLTEVLNEVGLSKKDIGLVIKNDRWAPLDCIIDENDVVQLFPHLEGG